MIEFIMYMLVGSVCTFFGIAASRTLINDREKRILELMDRLNECEENLRKIQWDHMDLQHKNQFYRTMLEIAGVDINETGGNE